MKKNSWYLVVLIVLGVAVYFLVVKKKLTTLNGKDDDFAVKDTAAINKIFLADMSGKSITLQRGGLHWIMNNTYPVRNDEIQTLLTTMKEVAIKYPVPTTAHNTVIKKLASTGVKVEIYDKNSSLIKSYYVGGPDPSLSGTYMMMSGSDKPYATYVPGLEGFLTTRYSLDTDTWRDRTIFSFDVPEISSVIVNYTDNRKESSFEIDIIRPDSFQLKPLNGKPLNKQVEKEKLFLYLLAYKRINAEGYENNDPLKDSLLHTVPFCTITVVDKKGAPHVVKCYHKKITERSMEQVDQNGQPLLFDTDHYYASINNGKDFVLIQQFHFGKLFKTYDYFFTPIVAPLKH